MQSLGGVLLLPVAIFGCVRGGWAGALTGAIAVLGIGSGLAIVMAERRASVDASGRFSMLQRLGGAVAAAASLAGAAYGGWPSGWMWGGAGYLLGIAFTLAAATLAERFRSSASGA